MNICQVQLRNKENELLTTWVDTHPKLKIGASITLKDYKEDVKWQVVKMWNLTKDAKDFDFHRKWDNNDYTKHTGLKV